MQDQKVDEIEVMIDELEIVELEDRLEFASSGRCDSAEAVE